MSSTALRVLLVHGAGVSLPAIAPGSAFGPFDVQVSDDLDAAAARLAAERYDAVVVAARPVDARKLLAWSALSQASQDPALIVLTVARFYPQKGHRYLARAIPAVVEQVTVVVPTGKNEPLAGEQTIVPQVPVVVGAG